jgi:Asp-tRNA(Asn)/Glu-tRNA(Gln) amidotransferase A subunit family amidase
MTAFITYVSAFLASSNPPRKTGMVFTLPASLAGRPAICLPCGFSPEGLPYSIQFVGPPPQ